ncbi:PaaI family thioesterase [Qaidamihabitans albus]|uniref:PaaI family thioesterase n=1 Tax=Qaidamihabitans albus TaxID=2795733 RepID=UPI0018F1DC6C
MAFAGLAAVPYGQSLATASLNVSYLRPTPTGSYRVLGHVERAGRSVLFAAARLVGPDGRDVAAGNSTLVSVPAARP